MEIIKGNLITLALDGKFDVIGHGCNCFCTMRRGIAPQMAKAFQCDQFQLEQERFKGQIDKLGRIQYRVSSPTGSFYLKIVNMYTQYHWSEPSRFGIPLDYDALRLCLVKMNHTFKGKHIGLPKIGCGLAGGRWEYVSELIGDIMTDCKVTIVEYEN